MRNNLRDYILTAPPPNKPICEKEQPCQNGATCVDLMTEPLYKCVCATGFTGQNCTYRE